MKHYLSSLFCCLFALTSVSPVVAEEHSSASVQFVDDKQEQPAGQEKRSNGIDAFADDLGCFGSHYYLDRVHSTALYHCQAISSTGDVLQLHDLSKWSVSWADSYQVRSWVASDDIIIVPNTVWFSRFQYALHNLTTNQIVQVDLLTPPPAFEPFTFHIVNIQPYDGLVAISDGTVWRIGSEASLSWWHVGQRVLLGVNNGWGNGAYPQIMINADVQGSPCRQANFVGYQWQ